MPQAKLKVELIACTPDADKLTALGARMCYSNVNVDDLRTRVDENDQERFLNGVFSSGHLSVMEHAAFTFAVEGVSRVLLAQLTRHRIASFSVQSQRYVSMDNFRYILPPTIEALGEEAVREYADQMETMQKWYLEWQKKLGNSGESANQDARFVLPGACETRLLITMNARELNHFFELRCCSRAQWEIRAMADEMLRLAYQAAPVLFEKAGPGCVCGACPEGKRSCGHAEEIRRHIEIIKKGK